MGLATGLLLGGLVGGYFLGRRGKGDKEDKPAEAPTIPGETPQQQVAATNPVSTPKAESENVSEATSQAQRTRRRAAAGNAGRVTTGPGSTPGVGAGGSQRSLIGY